MHAATQIDAAVIAQTYARYASAYSPKDTQPISDWARAIKLDASSPIAGNYNIENSLWMREQLVAWQDDDTRIITSIGPNQGGRTKTMEIASLWSVCNRPGPMQWNTDTNDKAKDFAEERWWPMARSCPEIIEKLPAGGTGQGAERHRERIRKVIFTDGMPFVIQGCSESNLEQKSIMTQFNDECFQWPVGRLAIAWIRCNVAYAWNYKIWNGSVAGIDGDDLDLAYKSSTQEEWHWHCIKCGRKQIPKWGRPKTRGGIHWETDKRTKPGGKEWDYEEVKKTVRYECEFCKFDFEDSARTRRTLNEAARYYQMNADAARWHRGFRFNILTVNWPGLSWGKWVEEFLHADEQLHRLRNLEPIKKFWTRRMSEGWDESRHAYASRRTVISDYKLGSPNEYRTKQWKREIMRFMAVDKQESNYYYVIRAVAENGESRLIDRGTLDSYTEIDIKAKDFGVQAQCVLIDCAFETREVYAMAVKYGWTCLLGVDRLPFKHVKEVFEGGQTKRITIELPYSEEKWSDPMSGTKEQTINRRGGARRIVQRKLARRYDWINLHIKNLLHAFKQGQALYWGVPSDAGADYIRQLNAEIRHKVVDAKGRITEWWSNTNAKGTGTKRPNHYWDCECMIVVALCLQGLIDLSEWRPDSATRIAGDTQEA